MPKIVVDDRTLLRKRVDHWARKLNVVPRTVRIQRMSRKWGSCSVTGTVTLADDLADHPREFQDVVIVHELLHLRHPNHGRVFKAVMSVHVPAWKRMRIQRSS